MKKITRIRYWLWILLTVLISNYYISPVQGETFRNGDIVCFLGDSITHAGHYEYEIYNFYLTRHPDWRIEFYNCGVGGDTAGGSLRRLDEDLFPHRPNQITVMFGMNDVGLNAYTDAPTEKQLATQKYCLEQYKKNYEKLINTLKEKSGAKITLITPSPFDHTGENEKNNNHPGGNKGLAAMGEFVKEFGAVRDLAVIDFNGPMFRYNIEQQKFDPKFTIIGADRVHPREPGHLMMAWLFLKGQGISPIVSDVAIDVKARSVLKHIGADLTALKIDKDRIQFDLLESALPFPIASACSELIKTLPIVNDLNKEMLCFKNLVPGTYELTIDNFSVGNFSDSELDNGINLAINEKTPQFKQAQTVRQLSLQRRAAEMDLREFAALRWFLLYKGIDPNDLTNVKKYYETKMAKGYFKTLVPHYIERWEKRAEYLDHFKEKDQKTRDAAHPVRHQYRLTKITGR